MLRASSQVNETNANLESIVGQEGDTGVTSGTALVNFAEAVVARDTQAIKSSRHQVHEELGRAATVDAAGIIANFQRMVRIADSTGIPLDEPVMMMSQDIRKSLNLNDYNAAKNTPKLSFGKRMLGKALGPFGPKLMARMARKRMGVNSPS